MTRFLSIALGCVLIARAPAAAAPDAPGSSFVVETDPRVELLGVVQSLAGRREKRIPLPLRYGKDLERRFGRMRGDAAVKLYGELADTYQEFGADILFLTDPPALRPADPSRPPPFGGGSGDFERFLSELRRFSAESGFADFYASHRGMYQEFEREARAQAAGRDFPKIVEDYVGRGLESRCHYILALSYAPKGGVSFIIPYPDPEHGVAARGPYDVYVLLTPEAGGGTPSFFGAGRGMPFDELIYVFVERTYGLYMRDHSNQEAALLAEGSCRDRDCLKNRLVRAIRLRLRAGGRNKRPDALTGLFAERLAAYEGARDRYPALDEFYPRLFAPPPPAMARPASPSVTVP
jgi:hypothetical protein